MPLLGLIGGVGMAIPWGFINKMQSGHFQAMPSAGGVNLYLGNRRGADGMSVTLESLYVNITIVMRTLWKCGRARNTRRPCARQGRQPDTDPMAVSKYWTERAIDEIKAGPGRLARARWRKNAG